MARTPSVRLPTSRSRPYFPMIRSSGWVMRPVRGMCVVDRACPEHHAGGDWAAARQRGGLFCG